VFNEDAERRSHTSFSINLESGDLLVIAALGAADVDAFFRLMSYSDWTCANIYHCEWLYLRLDQESFLQGRLVRTCAASSASFGIRSYFSSYSPLFTMRFCAIN